MVVLGAGGATIDDPALRLFAVTLDGSPAPYPGDSHIGKVFTKTGTGYQYNAKTTGLTSGAHTLAYSITGDPVRHTITLYVR